LVWSTLHGLGLANWPPRLSRLSADRVHAAPSRPSLDLGSAPEYDPRGPLPKQLPLLRFVPPTTLEARGSDQHRACLTRLCDAYRLLPPPGVSFLPRPSRLCFTPVTPLGFPLQRFAPLARPVRTLERPAPHDVVRPNSTVVESLRFAVRLPGRDRNAPSCRRFSCRRLDTNPRRPLGPRLAPVFRMGARRPGAPRGRPR